MRLLIPVVSTLIVDAIATCLLEPSEGPSPHPQTFLSVFGKSTENVSVSESIWLAVSLILSILVCTAAMVGLYLAHCLAVILAWLSLGLTIIISSSLLFKLRALATSLNVAMDKVSIAFLVANVAIVGNMAIFWRAPLIVTQFYLIVISVFATLAFLEIPDWTIWTLLVLLIVYDTVIVLPPQGLLRILIEKVQERGDPIPALVYSTAARDASDDSDEPNIFDDDDGSIQPQLISDEVIGQADVPLESRRTDNGLTLGLGDFIFYGTLVTRAARVGCDYVILAMLGVIFGLLFTLVCLLVQRKPLPALPFSLTLGLMCFVAAFCSFRRFIHVTASRLIVF
jgi:hypothetical protein